MPGWRVVHCPIPDSLEAPDAWGVRALAALSAAVENERWGNEDLIYSAADHLTQLRSQEYAMRVQLLALPRDHVTGPGATVLGTGGITLPRRGNDHVAELELAVHPGHRRRGVGGALLAECERIAAELGRTTVIAYSEQVGEPADGDPDALEPPTGNGRVAGRAPAALLGRRRGYVLEQAERYSVLPLPVEPGLLARLHAGATEHAGRDYRTVWWTDRTPEQWLEHMAHLRTRMTTDVPRAGLDVEEDPWDGPRVRAAEEDSASSGHGQLVVAAEHVPTGSLVAYTAVEYPLDRPEVVFQNDTLVLREHRGHRLGMLVKTALLRRLAELRPHAARVHTWNAEENAPMLGINVALGFRPAGVVGLWQKRLGAASGEQAREEGTSGSVEHARAAAR